MATAPAYASTVQSALTQVSVANTARDGTGTIATLVTAAANGTRIDDIYIAATGTTTAWMVRMFIHDGTNARLIMEIPVIAVTPSATTAVWTAFLPNLGIVLKTGYSLRFSTNNAETFNIAMTRGADF